MRGAESSLRLTTVQPLRGPAANGGAVRQSSSRPVRVYLVADVCVQRELLAEALANEERVELAGSSSGDSAARGINGSSPEVVVVDASAGLPHGRIGMLAGFVPAARTVAVGIPDDEALLLALVEAGVAGFVTAEQPLGELVEAITAAANGELRCSPRISAVLAQRVAALTAAVPAPRADHRLTRRQRQIAELLAEGLSNKQIAARLSIQRATVKNHVHNILTTLGATSRDDVATLLSTSIALD